MMFRQLLCRLLHGHDAVLHVDDGRVSMRCYSCGWQSPGIQVAHATPKASRPALRLVSKAVGH